MFKKLPRHCRLLILALTALLLAAALYIGLSWKLIFEARALYTSSSVTCLNNLAHELDAVSAGQQLPPLAMQGARKAYDVLTATNGYSYMKGFARAHFGAPSSALFVLEQIMFWLDRKSALDEQDAAYLRTVSEECKKIYDAYFFVDANGLLQPRRRLVTQGYLNELFQDFDARFAE